LSHGHQARKTETSSGKKEILELSVKIDMSHFLNLTRQPAALDITECMAIWLEGIGE
jgi:hypothetical protein